MLSIRRLILLRELESMGSLAAVARAQQISSAAVSQQLSKLETEVGLPLTEQLGRSVALTPLGRTLARRADELLQVLALAQQDVDSGRGEVQGTVRMSAFGTFGAAFFSEIVKRLATSHPKVVLEVDILEPTAALESVLGRRADVAITDEYTNRPQPVDSAMQFTRLFRDPVLAYSPEPVSSLRDLAQLPWVFEPAGTTAAEWAKSICRRAGFEPIVRYESPDLRFHHDLTSAGVAASFLPSVLFAHSSSLPRLPHEVHWPAEICVDLHRDVYAVVRRGAALQPATQALLNHVLQVSASPSRN